MEKKIKQIKIVEGYNYYIFSLFSPFYIPKDCSEYTIEEFYKRYIEFFNCERVSKEREFIVIVYLNRVIDNPYLRQHMFDIKDNFNHYGNYLNITLTKAKNKGKIYLLTKLQTPSGFQEKINKDEKEIFSGYCNLVLSDKLLERFDNECSQRDDKQN